MPTIRWVNASIEGCNLRGAQTVCKPFVKPRERNGNKNGFNHSQPFANGNDWSHIPQQVKNVPRLEQCALHAMECAVYAVVAALVAGAAAFAGICTETRQCAAIAVTATSAAKTRLQLLDCGRQLIDCIHRDVRVLALLRLSFKLPDHNQYATLQNPEQKDRTLHKVYHQRHYLILGSVLWADWWLYMSPGILQSVQPPVCPQN
ncbi:hypothetical protein C8J57DRAFT_1230144 [Mycena rebaudengoi]|nr:hypothetical protein C8J57DRAFT_1230144 [Mycena rebaudengoi]